MLESGFITLAASTGSVIRCSAEDLQTIARAAALSHAEDFWQLEIVVTYDDTASELVFPLRGKQQTLANLCAQAPECPVPSAHAPG
jgi:hypothetical protein